MSAARHGLDDRVLQRAAVAVFELALSALAPLEAPSWVVGEPDRGAGARRAARALPRRPRRPGPPTARRRRYGTRRRHIPGRPGRRPRGGTRMTVTEPGPAARRPPVRRVPGHGRSPAHPRRRAAGAGPRPHPRPHRRRRRGRPRRPALPADVAAGLGPRARGQPGGAVAGARRRWPRAAASRDRRALRRLPALAGQPGRAAAARPGRGARVRGGGPREGARRARQPARCAADGWWSRASPSA